MRATINPGCGQLNDEDPDESWPKFESCLITRVNYFHPFPTEWTILFSGNDHRHFVFVLEFKPEIWDYIHIFDKIFIYRCYYIEFNNRKGGFDRVWYIINRVHLNEWMKHFNDRILLDKKNRRISPVSWLIFFDCLLRSLSLVFWSVFDRWWELSWWYKCVNVWSGMKIFFAEKIWYRKEKLR